MAVLAIGSLLSGFSLRVADPVEALRPLWLAHVAESFVPAVCTMNTSSLSKCQPNVRVPEGRENATSKVRRRMPRSGRYPRMLVSGFGESAFSERLAQSNALA